MRKSILTNLFTASALAAALGGCGAPLDQPDVAEAVQAQTISGVKRDPRIMPLRSPDEAGLVRAAPIANLKYWGGSVMAKVNVISVFWGTSTNAEFTSVKAALPGFYTAVVNSPYLDWLSEYNTVGLKGAKDGKAGSNQTIGRGTYGGTVTITPSVTKTALNDSDVSAELLKQIASGKLPAADGNTFYAFHFPPGVSINLGGSGSCSAFCAYHNTIKSGTQSVMYGVHPFMGAGTGCASGCGTSTLIPNTTSVASHELIEAITDPEIGLVTGASIDRPSAWYDETNGEIGDICNGEQGSLAVGGATYTVQTEYSNKAGKCIVTAGTCVPSCTGKVCGPDGCGGTCGTCATGKSCNSAGQCVTACVPKCTGKVCGDDGCGGSCGTCASGKSCNSGGQCVPSCTPSCTGKVCGTDGCGGSCGTCASGKSCNSAGQCVPPTGTCSHDKCKTGKKLTATCDPCVQQICDFDSYCCGTKWDSACVQEVSDICGETC